MIQQFVGMSQIKGIVITGRGEGAFFTGLDWVKEQCREKLGFELYPGTLNLRVSREDMLAMQTLARQEGIILLPPSDDFCQARCIKVAIGSIKGAVILPHVVDYYQDTLEIIAAERVKDKLNLKDGDEVIVTVKAGIDKPW